MAIGTDDEAVLAARGTEIDLALARTQAGLSPRATITARTLLRGDATIPAPATIPDRIDLPRISIDQRSEPIGRSPTTGTQRDYAIVSTLGEGGMGRVHLARQRSLDRDVALKTLKPGAPWSVALALLHEAKLTGTLEHPGVIPVHMLGVDDDGRPMLVMKRVDGLDFGTLLADPDHAAWRAHGRAGDRLVAGLEILVKVCQTVEFAHSRHILHRDIKPENVMVGSFGEVYLLDWGIAMHKDDASSPGALVGTPAYMAPEMVRGDAVDERTDIYLLGSTLHELLTGSPRHTGTTVMQVLGSALTSAPFAYGADVPERLAQLANRATSREPAERPATARAFREEITDFLLHRSARELSDAALERVGELETALAKAGPTLPPADLPAAYRLATEARFGLVQSLRAHAGDRATKDAMRRCLAASIELELRQGHADTADALLREMEAPDATLAKRIAEERERAQARARDRARLETLDRDMNQFEQGQRRVVPLVALVVLAVVMGLSAGIARGEIPRHETVAGIGAVMFSVAVVGWLALRKRLLTNAFNRRSASLIVIAFGAMLVNRTLGMLMGTPVPTILTLDLALFATVATTGAVTLLPRLGWAAAVAGLGTACAAAWPLHASQIFMATGVLILAVTAWAVPRANRDGKPAPKAEGRRQGS
jgi:hypothetical protein